MPPTILLHLGDWHRVLRVVVNNQRACHVTNRTAGAATTSRAATRYRMSLPSKMRYRHQSTGPTEKVAGAPRTTRHSAVVAPNDHLRVDRLGVGEGRVITTEWSLSHLRRAVPGVEFGRAGGDRRDRSAGSATTDPAVAALWHFAARLPRARAPSFPVRRLTRTSRAPCSQHLRQGLLDQGCSREHGKSTHRGPPRRTRAPNDGRHAWKAAPERHGGRR